MYAEHDTNPTAEIATEKNAQNPTTANNTNNHRPETKKKITREAYETEQMEIKKNGKSKYWLESKAIPKSKREKRQVKFSKIIIIICRAPSLQTLRFV